MPENPNMPIGYDSWEQYEAECEAELRDARIAAAHAEAGRILEEQLRARVKESGGTDEAADDLIRLATEAGRRANQIAQEEADEPCPPAKPREFGDLSGAGSQPIRLQGGVVFLKPYGCSYCGNAFWTENDDKRRLSPGLHPCPHCGQESRVPDR